MGGVSVAFGYNGVLGGRNTVDLVFGDLDDVGAGAEGCGRLGCLGNLLIR